MRDLTIFRQRCIVCDKDKPRGMTCAYHGQRQPLAGVISAGAYGAEYIRRGVHWLKFRGVTPLVPTLSALIEPYLPLVAPLSQLQQEAVLVPIPLHKRRLRERGFNQSLELARMLSEYTGIPIAEVLTREKSTLSQAELPHEMRQQNMAGAFSLLRPEGFAGQALKARRYFLLIDDVITTGSTLQAAAESLKDAGAEQVWGVSVARG